MRSDLVVASAISVVLHLVVGVTVFGRLESGGQTRLEQGGEQDEAPAQAPVEPPEQKQPRLRLGIERSSHASVTWLGFETPEDHQVPLESEVEQAALSLQDVSGTRAGAPEATGQDPTLAHLTPEAPARESAEPLAAAAERPATPVVQPERSTESATSATPVGPENSQTPATPTALPSPAVVTVPANGPESDGPARDESLELTDKIGPKPSEVLEEAEKPVESPATPDVVAKPASGESAPEAAPKEDEIGLPATVPASELPAPSESIKPADPAPGPRPGASVGSADAPGEGNAIRAGLRSDKESPASALKRALKYRPGKPLAVQGLEVSTVEPRFPVSVRYTTNPRNPVLVIHFDRKGVVTRADFLKDDQKHLVYSTGEPAVDEPLRTAIFQWRAKGEELLRIPADNPDATVSIVMEIILNGR